MHVAPVTTGAMTLPAESPKDKFREYTYPGDVCRENLTFYVKDDEENDKYVETSAPTEYRQYWIEQKTAGSSLETPIWLDHETAGSPPEPVIPEPEQHEGSANNAGNEMRCGRTVVKRKRTDSRIPMSSPKIIDEDATMRWKKRKQDGDSANNDDYTMRCGRTAAKRTRIDAGNVGNVSVMIRHVSDVCQTCVRHVSGMCQTCVRHVSDMCQACGIGQTCVRNMPGM